MWMQRFSEHQFFHFWDQVVTAYPEIFRWSVSEHNLIYHEYLGDGDTNSFKNVVLANSYKDFSIVPIKLKCVGHVQKC